MATFGITPVTGYPIPPSDEFPQFIQMQSDGVDLGGPDVDTLNFTTNLTATRGTGENASTVTITASGGGGGSSLQFQSEGVDLGLPDATTVNFTGAAVSATRSVDTIVVDVQANPGIQFQADSSPVGSTDIDVINFIGFVLDATGTTLTINPYPALFSWTIISNGGTEYSVDDSNIGQGLILTDASSIDLPGVGGYLGYPITVLNTSEAPIPVTSLALLRYAARYTANIEPGGVVQIRAITSGEWSLTGDLSLAV